MQYIHSILNRKKKELKSTLNNMEKRMGQDLREASGEISLADNHPADVSTATQERTLTPGLYQNLLVQLSRVERALMRLEQGDYGICQCCGAEVDKERLFAMPAASCCRSCMEKEDDNLS